MAGSRQAAFVPTAILKRSVATATVALRQEMLTDQGHVPAANVADPVQKHTVPVVRRIRIPAKRLDVPYLMAVETVATHYRLIPLCRLTLSR
ncbi:MAG: hypothetical protein O2856_12610 [Planctomycetota bacterium]|nr:hypothetical protein [Planctomycetota bacterium]